MGNQTVQQNVHDAAKLRIISFVAYNGVLPAICAFGILGNVLNLLTLRSSALQTVSYIYLRALALADLICMLFILVFVVRQSENFPGTGIYAVEFFAAHMELPLINFFITAGVLIIVALTIERYVSVVWPLHFHTWNTAKRARTFICGAYVMCLILYLPMCWRGHVITLAGPGCNSTNASCPVIQYDGKINPAITGERPYSIYKILRETVTKVLPIAAMSYFNTHIIIKLRTVHRNRRKMINKQPQRVTKKQSTGQGGKRQKADEHRLLMLLAIIVVLFFVCNVPAAINLIFIKDALKTNLYYQTFRATANVLEIANHAVNFYIFCCCSKDYRQEFFKTFPMVNRIRQYLFIPCRALDKRLKSRRSETHTGSEQKSLIQQPPSRNRSSRYDVTVNEGNDTTIVEPTNDIIVNVATMHDVTANNHSDNVVLITSSKAPVIPLSELNLLDSLPETKLTTTNSGSMTFTDNDEIFV